MLLSAWCRKVEKSRCMLKRALTYLLLIPLQASDIITWHS